MISGLKNYMDYAIRNLELDSTESNLLMIADYGTNIGVNNSVAVGMVIDRLRQKYGAEKSVMIVHNDLPSSNLSSLFTCSNSKELPYLAYANNSDKFAVSYGSLFHNQIVPDRTLHFGISVNSLHWLSKIPCKLENHCISNLGTPKEIELFKKQAADDWEDFLAARSKEVVKGGVLVLNITCDPGMGYLTIVEAIYSGLRHLVDIGIMTEKELFNFNMPMYFRSLDDVTNAEKLKRHGFQLIIGEHWKSEPSHIYKTFISCKDKHLWALDIVHELMAVGEPFLLQSFSSRRSAGEKKDICSKLIAVSTNEISKIDSSQLSDPTGNVFVVLKKAT